MGPTTLWLSIPHRSQYDRSPYAETNCGPASLGMILDAYGLRYGTDPLRREVNRAQGTSDPEEGTALAAIAEVGRRAGLFPMGLYARPGVFKRWTLGELREQLEEGRPVITLVRYAALPGATLDLGLDHYIVLSGLAGDQFIYNDSSQPQGRGAGLLISREALQRAWQTTIIAGHAVAFARSPDGAGLFPPASVGEEEETTEAGEDLETSEEPQDQPTEGVETPSRAFGLAGGTEDMARTAAASDGTPSEPPHAHLNPPWWTPSRLVVPVLALVGALLLGHIGLALGRS